MKKLIIWVKNLSNGETAVYFTLIIPFILWGGKLIWESELSLTYRAVVIVLILLSLIISIVFFLKRNKRYDIFISYCTKQGEWTEALAKNLQQQGYKIFLDTWEIQAGQDPKEVSDKAMQSSRFALLITTLNATESGWAKDEYESLLQPQQKNPEFRCIPIILGEFPDIPFLKKARAIDFKDSSKDNYAKAFQYLISALENQSPGANPYFKGALQISAYLCEKKQDLRQQELRFLEEIFSCLDMGSAVMILHQVDTTSPHYSTALLNQAQQYFGKEQCLTLSPPHSSDTNKAAYFSRLSQQCGFSQPKETAWEWADALSKRLQQQSNELFILMSNFENGSDAAREDLAGELRSLLNYFPNQLKLVIFGAEKLAAMKYQNGRLSLLNQLEEKRLPELNIQDLQHLFNKRYSQLKQQSLTELFHFTGQHLRLIHACLQNHVYTARECEHYLANSSLPSQLFSPFQSENKAQLCHYLQQQEICNYSVWPQEELLRKLYWNNLIKRSKDKFIWRSEYIRKIGKQNVECDD